MCVSSNSDCISISTYLTNVMCSLKSKSCAQNPGDRSLNVIRTGYQHKNLISLIQIRFPVNVNKSVYIIEFDPTIIRIALKRV